MSLYNIVNPASLVPGQPEDVSQVLANFQAIQAVLNGGIDDVNVRSTAAIQASKFAGYPNNQALALRGDGSWGRVSPTQQIFTTAGSGTYTTPAGVKAVIFEAIGGGGAGGGCPATSAGNYSAGGGGAGGSYTMKLVQTPVGTYAYVVGAGGVGVLNATGGTGGDTTIAGMAAKGGTGGGQTSQSVPNSWLGGFGVPQNPTGGDLNLLGSPGMYGSSLSNYAMGGIGGTAARGGSGGMQNLAVSADGNPGGAFGGGGSGAANNPSQATMHTGGAGGAGMIIVWEFY
jgi:hypothetical protein